MKTLQSLDFEKIQVLTENQLNEINGGSIFPKKGTDDLGWTQLEGQTARYATDWRTGWFSDEKTYGTAYVAETD